MSKYKIEYDAETCIGTMLCIAEAGQFFREDENGFTVLHNAKFNEATQKWELLIDGQGYEKAKIAEEVCPVEAIRVTKAEE